MWSIFSRDPAKDFAYTIAEKVVGLEEKSVWSLHQGKKKNTGETVSIFVFDVKSSSESQIALAKSSFKRIKTLRHPNILTFLDGIETDKVIYIATEPVTPLETFLQNNDSSQRQTQLGISWGLHKVAIFHILAHLQRGFQSRLMQICGMRERIKKGLAFLINDCNLIHNNVCMSSIFVDQAGEWKLGGVDYVYPSTGPENVPPVKILPYLERYDPPEKADLKRGIMGEKWSSDMWGLGCLIWEVFNGSLPRTSALKSFGKIPKTLVANYCELVSANPSSRPNPATFLQDCCRQGGFMNNPFIKTMLFLEEIQIKDAPEKAKFFSNLTNSLDSFPAQLSKNKVLPQLLNAYEFGNCGSMVLAPLFKVGKLLEQDDYQAKIVPCVVKLFSSSDRNTRVKLLQQIDQFIDYIQSQVVNDKIFPNIVSGFMDTNPVVRESTIKAMLFISSKLNYKNLNEELMKHFARLQAKDDQGGIRTNTTICLSKIATHLNPQTRQRILCSAFLRAIKDPFPPARQAGIIGMAVTKNLYTLTDVCQKLMPPLCTMLMDPEKNVRDQAFKALRSFTERLEQVSENPELREEMERDVQMGGSANTSAAGWAGWAMGGVTSLTSKVYSKASKSNPQTGSNMSGSAVSGTSQAPTASNTNITPPPSTIEDNDIEEEQEEPAEDEGWNDNEDWGEIEVSPVSKPTASSQHRAVSNTHNTSEEDDDNFGGDDGWDDDGDWGSLEDPSPKHVNTTKSRTAENTYISSNSANLSDRTSNKQTNNEWGWEDDSSVNTGSYNDNKPQKGALKLGGPKKAPAENFGWIEEEFAPIEDNSVKPASAYDWGSGGNAGDDFFSMASTNVQSKTKPTKSTSNSSSSRSTPARESPPRTTQSSETSQNQSSAIKQIQSKTGSDVSKAGGGDDIGWDDGSGWKEDPWGALSESKETEADRKKREREEKRQQRQQELALKREARKGGAMKLGVKKGD